MTLNISRKNAWILIFTLCFIYWIYLVFNSKMAVVFDSVEYEETGRLIYQNGWRNFFQTGPHREPLYPALIALSMSCANFLSTDYQLVLKALQVLCLFITQILLVVILRKFNIREWVIMAAVFYFGISPAMINAALSIYYEIVVFPFVALAVLLAGSLWFDIHKKISCGLILGKAVIFAACFSLLAFGRDLFQYVFYFFVTPFCISIFWSFFTRRLLVLRRLLVFICAAFIIFYSSTSYFKSMNLRYNGEYLICRSHLSFLLGGAYKRSQPVSPRILASHIATIPGTGFCRLFFTGEECDYADWQGLDQVRVTMALKTIAAIPMAGQEREVLHLTIKEIITHPFQHLFFTCVEALKMPFWESTKIGFVYYPKFLTKFYNHLFVRLGLRLFFGVISLAAFLFVSFSLWRHKRRCFNPQGSEQNMVMLFFAWLMIAAYTFFYSLCFVVTRYALPIASMFIVCISFTVSAMIHRAPRKVDGKAG